jgi:iron complex transport system ATP-binding protein
VTGTAVKPLSAAGLSVRLGGRPVLAGVALTLRPGEVTAIVGPNGAGKSTLLACLAGLRRPNRGEARLGDQGLLSLPARVRARRIGVLPQTPEIAWRLEVEALVALGRTPHMNGFGPGPQNRGAVERAMKAADVEAFAGRDVASLSGGERGRVLIARALAGEPQWLLADEPLTGLDLGHQLDVAEVFRAFAREGGGVVVTLHDLGFAARAADRVLVLAEGRILADGAPVEAMSPDVLRSAYGVEAAWRPGQAGPVLDLVGRRA